MQLDNDFCSILSYHDSNESYLCFWLDRTFVALNNTFVPFNSTYSPFHRKFYSSGFNDGIRTFEETPSLLRKVN